MEQSIKHSSSAGFSLLEVLLVTVLLSFLAYTTFIQVRSSVNAKEAIDLKTEMLQESRAAIAMLDRDIRSATILTADDTIWEPIQPKPGETPLPIPPKPLPVTIFNGKSDNIFFAARSHQRMSADVPENEQHFVTYQLNSEKALVRAETARAVNLKDRADPGNFKQIVLLKNIKSLVFSYWNAKSEKWVDRWDSESSETQDQLPPAVKVEIEYLPDVEASGRRKIEPIKIATSVRLTESVFKLPAQITPTPKPAAAGQGATPVGQ